MAFSKLSGKSINLSSFVLTSFASTGIDDNATSTAITIDSNGDLGIGTADPQAILDVRANTNATVRIANDGDGIATLYLRNTGTNDGSISQEAGDMFFQIAGDKKIELRNDGNFGIGRLNPDARLTVDTDQQLIARFASSNVGITGVRLEGIDTSATDNVYVDWFYDAENRQYGFGEGTSSGSLPINSGIDHADLVIKDGDLYPSGSLVLSNGGKLQVSSSSPQNADLTGGSTNGTDSDGLFAFYGGLSYNTGAGIVLNGEDHPTNPNLIRFMNGAFVEQMRINSDGTQKATLTNTVLKSSTNFIHYDFNVAATAAQWTGADYTKSGIFLDMDATGGTGGNTADELRLYGIRCDLRSTHQTADSLTGVYGYVESQHSTGTTTNLYGVYGYAVADDTGTGRTTTCIGVQALSYGYGSGTGGVTSFYALYGKTLLSAAHNKNTTAAYGLRGEIEVDNPGQAQTLTNAYIVASEFDNDSASNVTITNSYLYYGNYAGTLPTNAYGLYILDSVENYLAGSFSVGGTKNFQIRHPLPALAETHDLVHTAIEAPSADNIYSGMLNLVNGSATVNIDTVVGMTEGTFVALNRNIRRFVSNEEGFTAVKSSITGNILTITAQDNTCTDEVFWMVIGQRQDEEIKTTPGTDADGYLILEPEHVEHVRPEKAEVYDERNIGADTVEEE